MKYDKLIAEKCVEDASEYIWLRWEAKSFLIGNRKCQIKLCSAITHQNPHGSKYITTFKKTIRIIAEHSLIWHFRLPIKTLLAYQRN